MKAFAGSGRRVASLRLAAPVMIAMAPVCLAFPVMGADQGVALLGAGLFLAPLAVAALSARWGRSPWTTLAVTAGTLAALHAYGSRSGMEADDMTLWMALVAGMCCFAAIVAPDLDRRASCRGA